MTDERTGESQEAIGIAMGSPCVLIGATYSNRVLKSGT